MTDRSRLRVAVIGTGGTISGVGRHSLDLYEYMDFGRRQEADELVARFPEVGTLCDVVDELVGWHTAKIGDRWAALEPIRQGVRHAFGQFDKAVARGVK